MAPGSGPAFPDPQRRLPGPVGQPDRITAGHARPRRRIRPLAVAAIVLTAATAWAGLLTWHASPAAPHPPGTVIRPASPCAVIPMARARQQRRRQCIAQAIADAIAAAIAAVGGAGGAGGLGSLWRPRAFQPQHGLASHLVPKGWQLITHGPAPGPLTCPTATTCYDQADRALTNRPVSWTSSRLYVSADGARTWRDIPLPSGLTFTSALACQTAQTCSAGAEDHGTPAFTVTTDGGRTWRTSPLPAAAGTITSLSCPAATTCRALAERKRNGQTSQFDEHLVTTDDGRHFTTADFPAGDKADQLSCPTASHCVAAGISPAFIAHAFIAHAFIGRPAASGIPAGLVLVSDDGGTTWHPGTLPPRVLPRSQIDCVDAQHCFEIGLRINQTSSTRTVSSYSEMMVSDDGGATWQERPLPARYPDPGIDDLACVSARTCYITGDDAVPQSFDNGKAISGSTPIAAVTQDAGLTWQAIGLPEPPPLPPGEPPDVFMSVSSLQCPKAGTCIALADNVAGNKYAAIYTTAP